MDIFSEPDFKEFNGLYLTTDDSIETSMPFDLTKLGEYMRVHNKNYKQLTIEELKRFVLNGQEIPSSLDDLWID